MAAATDGNKELVKILLDRKDIDVNAITSRGRTALTGASSRGQSEIVEILIKAGADVNIKNAQNQNALNMAMGNSSINEKKYRDTVQLLLQSKIDMNNKNDDGQTALMEASERGKKDLVEMLINAGADIHIRNKKGYTALTLVLSILRNPLEFHNLKDYTDIAGMLKIAGEM